MTQCINHPNVFLHLNHSRTKRGFSLESYVFQIKKIKLLIQLNEADMDLKSKHISKRYIFILIAVLNILKYGSVKMKNNFKFINCEAFILKLGQIQKI